ncbi:hypothetical protein [Nostoc phage Nsp-JY10]
MTDNLAPCPFCGGEPKLRTHRSGEDSMECYVECPSCEVRTTYYEDAYAPVADATGAWNRRTPPPSSHLVGAIAAFEASYPELYWTIAKGRVRSDEPLYGAVISTQGLTDIGKGESNISAADALRIAVDDAGLTMPDLPRGGDAE